MGSLGWSLVTAGAIAGLIAAVLLPLGVRWLMVVDAVACLAAAAVALFFLPRKNRERPVAGKNGKLWRPPVLLLRFTLASTAFAVGYLAVVMFMPLVLLQRGAPAWVPGIALAGAAVLAPLALWATRRLLAGRSHSLILAGGTFVLGLLALAMAGTGEHRAQHRRLSGVDGHETGWCWADGRLWSPMRLPRLNVLAGSLSKDHRGGSLSLRSLAWSRW